MPPLWQYLVVVLHGDYMCVCILIMAPCIIVLISGFLLLLTWHARERDMSVRMYSTQWYVRDHVRDWKCSDQYGRALGLGRRLSSM